MLFRSGEAKKGEGKLSARTDNNRIIPCVNIYGAAIGSVACYAVAFTICFHHLRRTLPLSLPAGRYFWKPLLCTGLMAVAARGCYAVALSAFHSNSAAVLLTVFTAVIVYLALVLAVRILTPEDICQLPLGERQRQHILRMLSHGQRAE